MSSSSRPPPSRLLGQAMRLAGLYLSEFKSHVTAVDLWFNGQVIMLRAPGDGPNELENNGECWTHVGTMPYE